MVDELYSADAVHPGLSFWSLNATEFPLTTSVEALKPPYYGSIHHTPATTYHMPVVPFNLPDQSRSVEGELPSHYLRSGLRGLRKRKSEDGDSKTDTTNDNDVLSDVKESYKIHLQEAKGSPVSEGQ